MIAVRTTPFGDCPLRDADERDRWLERRPESRRQARLGFDAGGARGARAAARAANAKGLRNGSCGAGAAASAILQSQRLRLHLGGERGRRRRFRPACAARGASGV